MKDIDELICATLCEEDARWINEWDEQSLTEQVVASFRGRSRWLVILVYAFGLLFAAAMVWTGIQFFRAETSRNMILYAAGFFFCSQTVAMLKTWYWMELSRNSVTREVKCLKMQVARLAHELANEDEQKVRS